MTSQVTANAPNRLGGLRRFAIAITVFNILGHTVFGFEQAWIQPLVSIFTAYVCEIWFELVDCYIHGRKPRFSGGWQNKADFLLSAHITGIACAMLLYSNSRLMPIVFASASAICSKVLFRVAVQNGKRHFLNPSNFGITLVLLLFPWVGIAPPYHFSENIHGWGSWILPAIIVMSGSFLNVKFTKRICVAIGWVGGFLVQGLVRNLVFDVPLSATLLPMTGVAFVLFTFYMVTDPATSPCTRRGQLLFGILVSATYGLLVTAHVVFGFFFALTLVSLSRGITLYAQNYLNARSRQGVAAQAATALAREMA
ncbi:MAG TPA: RnfABCDGE type electron transport complex subunit D [Candidatus Angelobacter sp.]|nr:RnfABCDGE type electron transport complex subunit D [Candidatus Angelobacter sp.]